MKIALITGKLNQRGGVASYYNCVLPWLKKEYQMEIINFQVGSRQNTTSMFHPILDQIRFRRLLQQKQPDLIHLNPSLDFKSFLRDGLLLWQAKNKNIPVLIFFRGWQKTFEPIVDKYFKAFFNHTYLKADHFIVLAESFKKRLRKWGVESDITLAATAVDDDLLKNVSIENKLSNSSKNKTVRILFLSRIQKEKGVFETIDAYKLLSAKGHNISLSIAGDGDALQDAKKYAAQKNIPDDRLTFLGYISGFEKQAALLDHDIYCFPTRHGEGMPNSVLEAMAFGMPVVTLPVGGIKDFFQNGKMGFLANSTTPEDIAAPLEKLVNDKELIQRIGQYNSNYANNNFLASIGAKKLTKTYTKIVQ